MEWLIGMAIGIVIYIIYIKFRKPPSDDDDDFWGTGTSGP
jgi:hypothetical protein